jgi:hypothetical protein
MNNPRVFTENMLKTVRSQSDSVHFQDHTAGNLKVLILTEQTKSHSHVFLVHETKPVQLVTRIGGPDLIVAAQLFKAVLK